MPGHIFVEALEISWIHHQVEVRGTKYKVAEI